MTRRFTRPRPEVNYTCSEGHHELCVGTARTAELGWCKCRCACHGRAEAPHYWLFAPDTPEVIAWRNGLCGSPRPPAPTAEQPGRPSCATALTGS